MILTAHQPVYLPWLGLFHKIALSEKFCIFDMVQYQTKDYNNRNKIKTKDGAFWLSVPVESKDHFNKKLIDVKIVKNGWNKKHFKSILLEYKKAKYINDYIDDFENFYLRKDYVFLVDLCNDMLVYFLDKLGITVPIVKASSYNFSGEKSDLVLDMCVQLEANHYIFGSQGQNYANNESFAKKNVSIYFQDYNHPIYEQLHGEFLPNLSIVDLLLNEGPRSREILMSGNLHSIL